MIKTPIGVTNYANSYDGYKESDKKVRDTIITAAVDVGNEVCGDFKTNKEKCHLNKSANWHYVALLKVFSVIDTATKE